MRVIRSAGQNVSPSDDGRLFDQAFTDGLFEEATITATGGNTITLSALYGIICGRDFTAEAQTISATLPDSDTATGYVYVEFDTSSEDIITIGTALAPFTPTYEDINTNGAVVQMVIAQYEASAVAVTSVTPTYMIATAGSVKAGSIATVEKSPAVANHSIGEFILYGGDLYEVTSAIAAGETLVVGTNIAAASIGDELSALNNGLTALEGIGDYSTTEKEIGKWIDGRTVYRRVVELDSDVSVSPSSWISINALPLSTYKHILNIRGYTSSLNNMWNLMTASDSGSYVRLLVARDGQSVNVRYLLVEYLKD